MLDGSLRGEANAEDWQTRAIPVHNGEIWSHHPVQDFLLHLPNAGQPGAPDVGSGWPRDA